MNETTVAQAMERVQLVNARRALYDDAVAVGLNQAKIAKIAKRSRQLVSQFFLGDSDSARLDKIVRREIDKRRAKAAKKASAA